MMKMQTYNRLHDLFNIFVPGVFKICLLSIGLYLSFCGYAKAERSPFFSVSTLDLGNGQKSLPLTPAAFAHSMDLQAMNLGPSTLTPASFVDSMGPQHSSNHPYGLLPQSSWKNSNTECKDGNFEGIGASLHGGGPQDVVVISPLPNSPALRAGLRRGDIIRRVDGHPIRNMSLYDVVRRIRGPRHSTVTLGIERRGSNNRPTSLSIKIMRDVINLKCPKK